MSDTLTEKIKHIPKPVLYGAGIIGVLLIFYFRQRAAASAAQQSASTSANDLMAAMQLPGGLSYSLPVSSGSVGFSPPAGMDAIPAPVLPVANSLQISDLNTSSNYSQPRPATSYVSPTVSVPSAGIGITLSGNKIPYQFSPQDNTNPDMPNIPLETPFSDVNRGKYVGDYYYSTGGAYATVAPGEAMTLDNIIVHTVNGNTNPFISGRDVLSWSASQRAAAGISDASFAQLQTLH